MKKIGIGIGLILIDVIIYIILGLLLMNYDDFYDESKGDYWSFESMSNSDRIIYMGFTIWNGINLIIIIYLIYRLIIFVRRKSSYHISHKK